MPIWASKYKEEGRKIQREEEWKEKREEGRGGKKGFNGKGKKHILYNEAFTKINVEMIFKMAYVITIN